MATKTIVKYRARPKAKHRSKAGTTVPLAMIAGLAPAVMHLLDAYRMGGLPAVPQHLSMITTGYDPADGKWKPAMAVQYLWGPLAIGMVVHKLAGKLGINRALAAAGIPIVRL